MLPPILRYLYLFAVVVGETFWLLSFLLPSFVTTLFYKLRFQACSGQSSRSKQSYLERVQVNPVLFRRDR